MKRHIERKHFGGGKPVRKYLSGNSIYNPVTNSPHRYGLHDEYSIFKTSSSGPFFNPSASYKPDTDDFIDRSFKHIFRFVELQNKIKSLYPTINPPVSNYFSPPAPQSYDSFNADTDYVKFDDKSQYQSREYRNYEGVTGFRADICQNCFSTLIIQIRSGPEKKIEHKCYPNGVEAVKKLGFLEYAIEYLTKVNKIPEVLFQRCMEWSNNTTGRLYLKATKIQHSVEGGFEIHENHLVLQFFKALAEQKMVLNDMQLFMFLRLAKKGTSTFVTVKRKPGDENSNYLISVSNV